MILLEFPIEVTADRTGNKPVVPGLVDEDGSIMMPLLRYQIHLYTKSYSQSHLEKVRHAVKLFAEYSLANPRPGFGAQTPALLSQNEHYEHFRNFRKAVIFGTFDTAGIDSSGLNWLTGGIAKANKVISTVTDFLIWLDDLDKGNRADRYNPPVTGTKYEQLCAAAAYEWKRNKSLLGHTWVWGSDREVEPQRALSGTRGEKRATKDVKRISDEDFLRLLRDGFGTSTEAGLRDSMVSILMNKAGVRASEALGAWIIDVIADPTEPAYAYVKLLHPSEAKTKIKHGKTTYGRRVDYLRAVYHLPNRITLPKNNRQHLGWKSRLDALELYWAEPYWGKVFYGMYRTYLARTSMKRKHPYLFIDSDESGDPLAYDTFAKSYERAVYRAGLVPPGGNVDMKASGFTPHANRHSYGDRLKNKFGCGEKVVQKAMNHASVDSQIVYTVPSSAQTRDEIEKGAKLMARRKRELEDLKTDLKGVRSEIQIKAADEVPDELSQFIDQFAG